MDTVIGPGEGLAATSFPTDSGTANPTVAGALTVAGGVGMNTAGASSTTTINLNTPYMQQGLGCWFWNLSITHSAGTLTIAGADGTALSASNPAYLSMPSNATAGQMVLQTLTANVTLTVSDLTGNLGNMTTGVAYGNRFPLYIGFMADATDSNIVGCLTWMPHQLHSCTTSTDIGDPSSATADKQFSVFSFSDITEANYTEKAIGLIGSVTATKDASDIYTLDALDPAMDGIGRFQEGRVFTYGGGTFGAAANSLIKPNGGTAPEWSTAEGSYTIDRNGQVDAHWYLNGDSGTDGSGGVTSFVALPFALSTANYPSRVTGYVGWGNAGGAASVNIMNTIFESDDPAGVIGIFSGGSNFQNSSFSNGSRRWAGGVAYVADNDYN